MADTKITYGHNFVALLIKGLTLDWKTDREKGNTDALWLHQLALKAVLQYLVLWKKLFYNLVLLDLIQNPLEIRVKEFTDEAVHFKLSYFKVKAILLKMNPFTQFLRGFKHKI